MDEKTLRQFVADYNEIRNRHDIDALGEFFADDADLIGATGRISIGKHHILETLREEHSTVYRESKATREIVRIHNFAPDAAVITGRFSVVGTRSRELDSPMVQSPGIFTMVLNLQNDQVKISAYRSMVPRDVFEVT